jgi:hypothetical protein
MASLGSTMRATTTRLLMEYGNSCTLSEITKGAYNPVTGKSNETKTDYLVYSALIKDNQLIFGTNGINTNLSGFSKDSVIIGWLGKEVTSSWKYNDQNIIKVEKIEMQNIVIAYILDIGIKE